MSFNLTVVCTTSSSDNEFGGIVSWQRLDLLGIEDPILAKVALQAPAGLGICSTVIANMIKYTKYDIPFASND